MASLLKQPGFLIKILLMLIAGTIVVIMEVSWETATEDSDDDKATLSTSWEAAAEDLNDEKATLSSMTPPVATQSSTQAPIAAGGAPPERKRKRADHDELDVFYEERDRAGIIDSRTGDTRRIGGKPNNRERDSGKPDESSAKAGGSSANDGESSAKDGGTKDKDGGSSAKDGESSAKDGGTKDKDGGSSANDGGTKDKDGGPPSGGAKHTPTDKDAPVHSENTAGQGKKPLAGSEGNNASDVTTDGNDLSHILAGQLERDKKERSKVTQVTSVEPPVEDKVTTTTTAPPPPPPPHTTDDYGEEDEEEFFALIHGVTHTTYVMLHASVYTYIIVLVSMLVTHSMDDTHPPLEMYLMITGAFLNLVSMNFMCLSLAHDQLSETKYTLTIVVIVLLLLMVVMMVVDSILSFLKDSEVPIVHN